jgi:CBS domain containing-hemolysin-like protein
MTATIVNLLVALFLLAANAFYVAAEFALVKSRVIHPQRSGPT